MLLRASSNNREVAIQTATSNPFAVAFAHRYFRRYEFKMTISEPREHELLFKHMPAFNHVLIAANLKLAKFRYQLGKRRSAVARRTEVHRIGPTVPHGSGRLNRTVDGFLEEYARNQKGRVRQVWDDLLGPLMSIASNAVHVKDEHFNRRDRYQFEIDGSVYVIKYGHFERIFTRSRKPIKTLGELISFRCS